MKPKKSSKAIAARCEARRRKRRVRAQQPPPQVASPVSTASGISRWALTGALVVASAAGFGSAPRELFAQAPANAAATSPEKVVRSFEIPAGRLSRALEFYTRTTGFTITDPDGVVGTLDCRGITASVTAEQALRRLLGGTGVTYVFTSARAIRLTKGSLPQLATVSVVGDRQRATAVASDKYTEPLRDVPQTITVVPRDILESQGVTSLRDAVRNVTGLTVNAGEGGSTPGDNFNIRGFSARSDIFVDGMRDNGGYSRETFNVEQVEVSKGPGSVYSGRGSTGGSINMVTKTPHLGTERSGVFAGGNADYGRATVDLNQPLVGLGLGGTGLRVNGQWQNSGVANLEWVKNKSWGVAPSIALGLGSSTPVYVQYFVSKQDNIPTYGVNNQIGNGPPVGVDPHKFYGLRNLDFEKVEAQQGTVKVFHTFHNGTTLRNQTSYGESDVNRIVIHANTDGQRRSPSHITNERNLTNQTSLNASVRTGRVTHAISSGFEASHENSRFASYVLSAALPKVNLLDPNPADRYTGTYRPGRPRRSAIANSMGLYTFDTMKFGENFEMSFGLRWDSFSPQYKDSLDKPVPTRDSKALTWRTGAVYKPTEHGSIYTAYGTSFNPTGELLAQDARGTIGLDPEKNNSLEAGVKWDFMESRLLVSSAVFRTNKTNARIIDPDDPLGTTLVLEGSQRVDGMEFGATGRLTDGWMLFASYTYLDSKIIHGAVGTDNQPLPNTPMHSLSLWSSGKLPGNVEIGGGTRYVGDRFRSVTQTVPGYWAWDADVGYAVTRKIQLRLNLINLTNETYFDNGRFWVPAAGRSFKLSTSVRY